MHRLDLTGKTFGRLIVIECAGASKGRTLWRCVCQCGGNKVAASDKLQTGSTRSCGCIQRGEGKTKQYYQERNKVIRREQRAAYLADKCCVDCGSKEHLEIDHVDRTLKVTHRVFGLSQEKREAELKKCVVRCQPCHQKKTDRDLDQGYVVHGTVGRGYRNGCRCQLCLDARSAYRREKYKAKKDSTSENLLSSQP